MSTESASRADGDNLHWSGSWADVDEDYPLLEKHVVDSLGMITLISLLEEEFDVEIDDDGRRAQQLPDDRPDRRPGRGVEAGLTRWMLDDEAVARRPGPRPCAAGSPPPPQLGSTGRCA